MSSNRPRLSIGFPVYNGENFIRESLESLTKQTFTDFELIICDNASTDNTEAICREYASTDPRISYYRNSVNVGAADNYNRVFELAAAPYFKWAAHDDICEAEYLERCVAVLDKNPDVVLCYAKTKILDRFGKHVRNYEDGYNKLISRKPSQRFKEFHRIGGHCNPVFGVIRSEVLAKTPLIGKYPGSDRVLLGELALWGQFYEVPAYLFGRRMHAETSLGANQTDAEVAGWFDPKKSAKIAFPRWRRLEEYIKSISRVDIARGEKARCYLQLFGFIFSVEKWRQMLPEAARIRHFVFRAASKEHRNSQT
jgi:glycosyltransferase involved in cell wall biosynthesis